MLRITTLFFAIVVHEFFIIKVPKIEGKLKGLGMKGLLFLSQKTQKSLAEVTAVQKRQHLFLNYLKTRVLVWPVFKHGRFWHLYQLLYCTPANQQVAVSSRILER